MAARSGSAARRVLTDETQSRRVQQTARELTIESNLKQIDPTEIEQPEQQESRARERLRQKPMFVCALIVGAIVLVFPAGPWMSHEAFITAMGRILSKSWIVNMILHFIFAIVYGASIAAVIYRFRVAGALCFGVLMGAGLYGASYVLFALGLGYSSNELHVCIEHIVFGLFFAAAYKGASVPRPRWKATGRPVTAEDKAEIRNK